MRLSREGRRWSARRRSAGPGQGEPAGDIRAGLASDAAEVAAPTGEELAAATDQSDTAQDEAGTTRHGSGGWTSAIAAGAVIVLALAGVAGWSYYGVAGAQQLDRTNELFVEVATQGAMNLASISSATVEDDVRRILDSSVDPFFGEFQQRSASFLDFVQQANSTSRATIREAGLESTDGRDAQVLVALAVNVSADGLPADSPSRSWRMRITVHQNAAGTMKLSRVEFVP